jgi:transaldolase
MTTSLDQLKAITTVVCDSGDFQVLDQFKPTDATTNPSLILAASKKPEYAHLVDEAVAYGKANGEDDDQKVNNALDYLLVLFGREILKRLPEEGRVSTEVDAAFSYSTKDSATKAKKIIEVNSYVG